ncbi:MAG: SurA N-terminal domain-containing protein [Candidatus Omnitrophota bacterium]
MLKMLRNKKTAKKVWIVLAILIVPAFVLWGSGSLIQNQREAAYTGKIFGRNVSFLEYKDALDAVRNQAIMQFGESFSEVQKTLNLELQAQIRVVLLSEAKKRKITVSDKEIVELLESYPFFQRNGQFDNRLYSETLKYIFHAQPRAFEEQTRQNIMISKLYKRVTDGVETTEEEIKKEYRKTHEEISLYYASTTPSDFTKDLNPSEEDLKSYFAANSLQFKQPVSFNVEYIALESGDKIQEVILHLSKRTSLNKIAEGLGVTLKETGLFAQTDPIPGIGWSPEISNLIAKLKPGQCSPPIQMDKYYYILRLKEIKEAFIPEFEGIKDKVREMLIKDISEKSARSKMEECLAKLKESYRLDPKSADFGKIVKECGLKVNSTDYFKYGSYIEGIGASDTLWMEALELKEDGFSGIINMPSGFYIIKIKSRNAIDEKKYTGEKADFSKRALLEKKQEYFTKFIEELKRRGR